MKEILHYSLATGEQRPIPRPTARRLAVHAQAVERFAAIHSHHRRLPIAQHPGFSFCVIFFGETAHVHIYHVDVEEPVIRAIVCWGKESHAARAFDSLMHFYLGYISRDPDGVGFMAEHAPVMPVGTFVAELGTPELNLLPLDEDEFGSLRELIQALAFNAIDFAPLHRERVLGAGDPSREYST